MSGGGGSQEQIIPDQPHLDHSPPVWRDDGIILKFSCDKVVHFS